MELIFLEEKLSKLEYNSILDNIEIKRCANDLQSHKSHIHKELSIAYIESGTTTLKIKNIEYRFKKGEAVIIYPYVPHQCNPDDVSKWKVSVIYIKKVLYKKFLIDNYKISVLDSKNSLRLKKLFDLLYSDRSNFIKENFVVE